MQTLGSSDEAIYIYNYKYKKLYIYLSVINARIFMQMLFHATINFTAP